MYTDVSSSFLHKLVQAFPDHPTPPTGHTTLPLWERVLCLESVDAQEGVGVVAPEEMAPDGLQVMLCCRWCSRSASMPRLLRQEQPAKVENGRKCLLHSRAM